MNKRNPKSPWNPALPADLTPEAYEKQVVRWLEDSQESLESFQVQHLRHLDGPGGDYELDAVASFTILRGAKICVVVECKRYSSPVERDHLLALWAKKEDVNAQKAMMFATCGYQSGALEYAAAKGIATVTFVDGSFLYETRALGLAVEPPPWVVFPEYSGIMLRKEGGTIHCGRVENDHV